MQKYTYWFREIADLKESWTENISYGKLLVAGFPIPTGFFIGPEAKQEIKQKVCVEDLSRISPSSMPEEIRKQIVDCYFKLNLDYDYNSLPEAAQSWASISREANLVLVKAGPKAYPNVRGTGELLEAVLKCMAASDEPILIQKMVSPEKGGVLITSKDGDAYLEATYGFASPILKGEIEPDTYFISKNSGDIKNKKLGSKQFSLLTNPYNRTIEKLETPTEKKNSYVLYDREVEVIYKLSKMLENYAGKAQKATWIISNRRVYLVDTSDYGEVLKEELFVPTNIEVPKEEPKNDFIPFESLSEVVVPKVQEPVEMPKFEESWDNFDKKESADNLFSNDFSGDLFAPEVKEPANPAPVMNFSEPPVEVVNDKIYPSYTPTKIGMSISNLSVASISGITQQNPSTIFFKVEDVFPTAGIHPSQLQNIGPLLYADKLAQALSSTVYYFKGKEILIALSDLRSDKFGGLNERNPLMGQRGARKLGSQILELEFSALSKLALQGNTFKLILPFVTSIWELQMAKDLLYRYGLANTVDLGAAIETPAAVSIIDQICDKVRFVLVNVDTLTELMLAVDRSNEIVKSLYDFRHDAVKNAVSGVIKICKGKNIPVYITGEALRDGEFLKFVREKGADCLIADSDNFNRVKSEITGGF